MTAIPRVDRAGNAPPLLRRDREHDPGAGRGGGGQHQPNGDSNRNDTAEIPAPAATPGNAPPSAFGRIVNIFAGSA